jgi:hypothetical protein
MALRTECDAAHGVAVATGGSGIGDVAVATCWEWEQVRANQHALS